MVLVIEECSKLLKCRAKALRDELRHPTNHKKIFNLLRGRKVRTIYKDRNGFTKTFFIDGITKQGANQLPAFGKFRRPYNISVTAYYYCRHGIRLKNPFTQCIIERFRGSGKDRFYPLELLEFVDEEVDNLNNKFANLFSGLNETESFKSNIKFEIGDDFTYENSGRHECSQADEACLGW
ncbi:unnamed protein product [Meloidogyne enterolobii]|uniref:Uncharacterized protein n=1 Tax=Meloidogyne enterolobii TaxID=390850 RepID=A0ACB0ZH58_MELEN